MTLESLTVTVVLCVLLDGKFSQSCISMAWLPLNLVAVARSGTILREILPGFPSKLHDIIWDGEPGCKPTACSRNFVQLYIFLKVERTWKMRNMVSISSSKSKQQ